MSKLYATDNDLPRGMSNRVLVIEDDPDVAMFERIVLERAGFTTQLAYTGTAGIEVIAHFKPAVVLLDVGLPDISGLVVCASLARLSEAFILMVSASSYERDITEALALGASDYIAKPFSGTALISMIRSCLQRGEKSRSCDTDERLESSAEAPRARASHVE